VAPKPVAAAKRTTATTASVVPNKTVAPKPVTARRGRKFQVGFVLVCYFLWGIFILHVTLFLLFILFIFQVGRNCASPARLHKLNKILVQAQRDLVALWGWGAC
jgi:hypothetical protein